jgi:hypothetical protein
MSTAKLTALPRLIRIHLIAICFALVACVHPTGSVRPELPSGGGQDLRHLQYFIGTWAAEVEDPRSGERSTLSYTVEPILSGAWLGGSGHSAELKLWVRDVWGRDPVTGETVRFLFDNQGIHGTVRSSGWTGDVMVLEGEARTSAGIVRVRETITRVDQTNFRAVWEMHADNKWIPYSVEQLKRVGTS